MHPFIKVALQRFDVFVELLSKRHLIERLQHGLVESLADAIRLRRLRFRLGMVDVVDGQVKLIIVLFDSAAEFRPAVSQDLQ